MCLYFLIKHEKLLLNHTHKHTHTHIYIVIHRQICFVLSELISVARHISFPLAVIETRLTLYFVLSCLVLFVFFTVDCCCFFWGGVVFSFLTCRKILSLLIEQRLTLKALPTFSSFFFLLYSNWSIRWVYIRCTCV